jgi:hypothetical protein
MLISGDIRSSGYYQYIVAPASRRHSRAARRQVAYRAPNRVYHAYATCAHGGATRAVSCVACGARLKGR